jgi:hypothetical protein
VRRLGPQGSKKDDGAVGGIRLAQPPSLVLLGPQYKKCRKRCPPRVKNIIISWIVPRLILVGRWHVGEEVVIQPHGVTFDELFSF